MLFVKVLAAELCLGTASIAFGWVAGKLHTRARGDHGTQCETRSATCGVRGASATCGWDV
jgi:hypothetical protein